MSPLAYLKVIAGLVLASLLFVGGWSCSASRTQNRLADTQRISDARARALRAAARSFDAFAGTFRAIDANTDVQIEEASRRAGIAEAAGGIAAAAAADAVARASALEQALARAKARSATCRVVMETDMEAACGITLR